MSKIQYNKLTTEKFIEKSISIHGKIYDYSKVDYNGSTKYVCIWENIWDKIKNN
jgi:hypothetical protein